MLNKLIVLIIGITIATAIHTCVVFGEEVNLDIIAKIESSNNPLAYNEKTQATGLYQITPVCLAEFKKFCDWGFSKWQFKQFTMESMFDEYHNWIVAKWYLLDRIPQMLRHFNKPVTLENILICYNAGINYVVKELPLPRETHNYIKKYKRLAR